MAKNKTLELSIKIAGHIKVLATRLAELGDTETGKDEIAEADKAYRKAIGGDEWPDWPDVGENRGEGGNSNDMEEV